VIAVEQSPVLVFDGKDDYVDLALGFPALGEAVTVELWARVDGPHGAKSGVFAAATAKNERVASVTLPWSGHVYWDAGGAGGYDRLDLKLDAAKLGVWTHWAFVKDRQSETMSIFVDGELRLHGKDKRRAMDPVTTALIGAFLPRGHHWHGALAELRIWDVARAEVEIQQGMHRRCTGHEMRLVGHWPLDEGEGAVAHDRTSYGRHGTIEGATWEVAELPLTRTIPMAATGLEDYEYWLRWKKMIEKRPRDGEPPFRRGRIWA